MSSTDQTTPVWAEPVAVNNTPVPHLTEPSVAGPDPVPATSAPAAQPASAVPGALAAPGAHVKSSRFKTAIVGTVAALVIGGGGFAVIRASGDSGAATSQQIGGQGAQGAQGAQNAQGGQGAQGGMGGGGTGGMGRGASGLSGVMYGDFVASDGNGGYVTRRMQTGTVTAVSATSITAKSADGHATTFVVTSSTTVAGAAIGDVKVGDTVTVVGTLSGDTATATAITDSTLNQANGGQQGGAAQNGQPPATN